MYYVFSRNTPGVCLCHFLTENEAHRYATSPEIGPGYYVTRSDASASEEHAIRQYEAVFKKLPKPQTTGPSTDMEANR